jgi:hypothetical protein
MNARKRKEQQYVDYINIPVNGVCAEPAPPNVYVILDGQKLRITLPYKG